MEVLTHQGAIQSQSEVLACVDETVLVHTLKNHQVKTYCTFPSDPKGVNIKIHLIWIISQIFKSRFKL